MSEERSFDVANLEVADIDPPVWTPVITHAVAHGNFEVVDIDPAVVPPETAAGDESSPEPAAARPDGWRCDVCGVEGPLPEQAGFRSLFDAHDAALKEMLAALNLPDTDGERCLAVLFIREGGACYFACQENPEPDQAGGTEAAAGRPSADG